MKLLLAALLMTGASLPAQAHLVTTGAGPFYDGAAHFFLSFEEVLPVLALALLAGLRGARYGRWLIGVLPPAWLLGAALPTGFFLLSPLAVTAALIVPGALAAWDRGLPLWSVTGIAILLALAVGAVNGAAMGAAGLGARGVLGAVGAAFACATLVAALVVSVRNAALRIAMRVAGSWLAAVGVLALGWTLKGVVVASATLGVIFIVIQTCVIENMTFL